MKNNNLALKVENLNVKLDDQKIIENLNFEVKKGETLVVLGPNGAGKTTLLRALLGVIPHEGKIIWSTKNINYLPPSELLQRRTILPLTVEDFYGLKEITKDKIFESLESVGLASAIYKKRIAHLSTGQFQRLAIAWVLVDRPEVLLLDESISGIDIGGSKTIYSLLNEFWKKYRLTIILVTHDLSAVWEHADNVLCLNKKDVCYGAPKDALNPEKLQQLYGTGLKYYQHQKS